MALGLLKDGTVAIQAALAQAQLQWPFLHDVSLISAITSVFLPPSAPVPRGDADAAAAAAGTVASTLQADAPQPWLYFNLLTVNSALFVPVLDKVRREDAWDKDQPTSMVFYFCLLLVALIEHEVNCYSCELLHMQDCPVLSNTSMGRAQHV